MNEKSGSKAEIDVYEDYQKILERKDIVVVTIVTPTTGTRRSRSRRCRLARISTAKKPLTLTINEGKQYRQDPEGDEAGLPGRNAAADRNGPQLHSGDCDDPRWPDRERQEGHPARSVVRPHCDAIPVAEVPKGLNWEKWLGQAPLVDFRMKEGGGRWGNSRCHYEFRWWYEYSGGKMTDWGAHHVDIASWAIGMDQSGPDQRWRLGQAPGSVQGRQAPAG